MTTQDFIQIILYFTLLIGLTPILGNFMFKVFTGEKHVMLPVFGRLERWTYSFSGINPEEDSNWKYYTVNLLLFNLTGLIFLFLMESLP